MKIVQLSQQDRAIIRACIESQAIGKATMTEIRTSLKLQDAINIDDLPRGDILKMEPGVVDFKLEEAEYEALKTVVNGDGKMNLSGLVMRQYVNCVDHVEVAKDAPKE